MRKATPATSPTSIAAEWEEAMLLSCLSPNENSICRPGSTASPPRISSEGNAVKGNSKQHITSYGRYHDDDDDEDVGGLLQLSSESSFTSFDSSDSDISLCRNTSPNHKNKQQQKRPLWGPPVVKKNNSLTDDSPVLRPAATAASSSSLDIDSDDDHHDDGDCSAITAVSLANLFLGTGGPCDLHLESDEGVEVVQAELLLTANNTRLNALTSSSSKTTLSTAPRPQQQQRLLLLADNNSHTTSSLSASRDEDNENHRAITKKATAATVLAVSGRGIGAVATTAPASTKINRSVHFGRVHIRQFGISISENPCVSEGPPIELGWDFRQQQPSQALSVDQYEAIRLPRRRRRLQDFLLTDRERRRMLLARYTHQDIKECIRQVEQIKRQRVLTYLMLPASALDEAAEDMYRYVTRSFK